MFSKRLSRCEDLIDDCFKTISDCIAFCNKNTNINNDNERLESCHLYKKQVVLQPLHKFWASIIFLSVVYYTLSSLWVEHKSINDWIYLSAVLQQSQGYYILLNLFPKNVNLTRVQLLNPALVIAVLKMIRFAPWEYWNGSQLIPDTPIEYSIV